ncbi:MAG: hypothetical protein ACI9KE_006082 [Polyangiales bacterium]|jgi:hypothetical protein
MALAATIVLILGLENAPMDRRRALLSLDRDSVTFVSEELFLEWHQEWSNSP